MAEELQYFGRDLEAMSFAQNYHHWILHNFAPYLGDYIAEVGAGTGNFSEFLINSNIKHLVAFEPSDNMFQLLKQKFLNNNNVDTINAFFETEAENFKNKFDSVLYVNVLEHIKDDKQALLHAYQAIQQHGHLLIFVPALSFLYSDLDKKVGHYRRYSKPELIKTVTDAGFVIKQVKYFDIAGIIPWYIAFVLLKQTTTAANVSLYDKWVVPVMRNIERIMPPFIGKNLILVGQKT